MREDRFLYAISMVVTVSDIVPTILRTQVLCSFDENPKMKPTHVLHVREGCKALLSTKHEILRADISSDRNEDKMSIQYILSHVDVELIKQFVFLSPFINENLESQVAGRSQSAANAANPEKTCGEYGLDLMTLVLALNSPPTTCHIFTGWK